MTLNTLTTNLTGNVRYEMLDGVEYLACPVAMIAPGVLNGSNGPLLYPEEECKKTPAVWNMKPVVVYHPQIDGQGVSATSRDIVEKQSVGILMNTAYENGKLRSEAWINPIKAAKVDNRIIDAIEKGVMMEVSTGVFTDNQAEEGNWNGSPYKAIARNYRADHLALLPDQIGACSIADGAGLLQCNALTHSDVRENLYADIRERFGNEAWIADVFPTAVIYERGDKLWKLTYSINDDVAVLSDDNPVQVKRNTQYRTVDGLLVGNASHDTSPNRRTFEMPKKDLVDALISNKATAWGEGHREQLMTQPEDTLKLMQPIANTETETETDDPKETKEVATPAAPASTTENTAVAQLSDADRAILNYGKSMLEAEKKKAIDSITANANNRFNREALELMNIDVLKGMADLAGPTAPTANAAAQPAAPANVPLFVSGAAPTENASGNPNASQTPTDNASKPLGLPTMDWSDSSK